MIWRDVRHSLLRMCIISPEPSPACRGHMADNARKKGRTDVYKRQDTKRIRNVDISQIHHLPMIDFIGNDFAIFDDIKDMSLSSYPTLSLIHI